MEDRELFSTWIAQHQRGVLDNEVTAELAELVRQVSDNRLRGKLVIEVEVEPGDKQGRTVLIGGTVTTKVPKPKGAKGIRYVGDGGTLHEDDPYQTRLGDGRTVDTDTGEIER